MSDFHEHMRADRRLVLLRVLLQSPAYTGNEYMLQQMAEQLGHVVSADQIRTDLAWLAEQGLLALETVQGVQIARLLGRGEDVARGRVEVPGVKKPRAG
jgi:hypothetical protein